MANLTANQIATMIASLPKDKREQVLQPLQPVFRLSNELPEDVLSFRAARRHGRWHVVVETVQHDVTGLVDVENDGLELDCTLYYHPLSGLQSKIGGKLTDVERKYFKQFEPDESESES